MKVIEVLEKMPLAKSARKKNMLFHANPGDVSRNFLPDCRWT